MEKMKALYEKVAGDGDLLAKFKEIMAASEKDGTEATKAKLTAFAKEAGYDVTIEEMRAFFRELTEKEGGPLSESELDMVAGGKGAGERAFSAVSLEYACVIVSAKKENDPVCQDPI